MTAEEFERIFERYLYGSLTPDENAALRECLQDPAWQRRWRELSDMDGALYENYKATESDVAQTRAPEQAKPTEDSGRYPDVHFGTGIHKFSAGQGAKAPQRKSSRKQHALKGPRVLRLRKWPLMLAASALIAVTFYFAFRGSGLTSVVPPQASVGKVIYVVQLTKEKGPGPTLVRGKGAAAERIPLTNNLALLPGDRIETPSLAPLPAGGEELGTGSAGEDALGMGSRPLFASVELYNGASVELADATIFEISGLHAMLLEQGLLYAEVNVGSRLNGKTDARSPKAETTEAMTFRTGFGDVKVEHANFDLRSANKESVVQVAQGALTFKNTSGEQALKTLQKSVARKDKAPEPAAAILASALWSGRRAAGSDLLAQINFQPATAQVPPGYKKDDGAVYSAARGYGWDIDQSANAFRRGMQKDARLDTYVCVRSAATWKYDLPNGNYLISLASGDPQWAKGPARISVEGNLVINDAVTAGGKFTVITDVPVTVADGQLTVQLVAPGREEAALNYLIVKKAPAK